MQLILRKLDGPSRPIVRSPPTRTLRPLSLPGKVVGAALCETQISLAPNYGVVTLTTSGPKGQLSNPRQKPETHAEQGSRADQRHREHTANTADEAAGESGRGSLEEEVQYSNPSLRADVRQAQRGLKPAEISQLLTAYLAGDRINDIAAEFKVSRTTVIDHVNRSGLPRRRDQAWTAEELSTAAGDYSNGRSLADVGARLGVNASTVASRFRDAGVPIRPRRGWAPP